MISKFSGSYRFLSNFYPATVRYNGFTYQSAEHAYQAAKATNANDRKKIRAARNAAEAKRIGSRIALRADWESVKNSVMLDILRIKFKKDPLKSKLLATGNAVLREGNTWGDRYWGVDEVTGKGKNWLGVLLMQVRKELSI